MTPAAFLFPGQGSQYVGMLKEFHDASPAGRQLIDRADALLGFRLSAICFEGPEEELRQTRNTQPAIFLHSMVVAGSLSDRQPDMVAGHSLGEYSALVVAGALTLEDGLRLVRLRGELMQRAGEEQKGTMAAIIGLSPQETENLCAEASRAGVVQPANFNSPGQIVISGSVEGVTAAMGLARQRGAKMVKELVVSGAFHSPLMESARTGLKAALDRTPIRDARIPVYANVTAGPVTRAEEIRKLLCEQLTSPVRWEEIIRNMARDGAQLFCEVGPGKVLQALAKRIAPDIPVLGFDRLAEITAKG